MTLPVGGREQVDIGIAEVAILGSTVWIDTDGDGVPDANEQGIPGVRVNLYDADGNLVDSVVADADGGYMFTDLIPGTYRVEIDADTIPSDLRATFDRTEAPTSSPWSPFLRERTCWMPTSASRWACRPPARI